MCLYEAQISGERLQDHWSPGFKPALKTNFIYIFFMFKNKYKLIANKTSTTFYSHYPGLKLIT